MAILSAINLANNSEASDCIIESDSLEAINAINFPAKFSSWVIDNIIAEVRDAILPQKNISFVHVKRNANKAAHWIASMARENLIRDTRVLNIPKGLSKVCLSDLIPRQEEWQFTPQSRSPE